MKICFLIHRDVPLSLATNPVYLAEAARGLGHEAAVGFIQSLTGHHGRVQAAVTSQAIDFDIKLESLRMAPCDLSGFDLVWILSTGDREGFWDRLQLLQLLAGQTRVVNAPDALAYLHSKVSLDGLPNISGLRYPETHISRDEKTLWDIFSKSNAEWVIKPVADMFGRGVSRLDKKNARKLINEMISHGYCLMQRYVPEIEQGEKRVLLAGGKAVGQYIRHAGKDFRTNLHQGGQASLCDLTDEERAACEQVGHYLIERGAWFVGLDVAWPYLLEWNVISPGGIATIDRLGGRNVARDVVVRITEGVAAGRKVE